MLRRRSQSFRRNLNRFLAFQVSRSHPTVDSIHRRNLCRRLNRHQNLSNHSRHFRAFYGARKGRTSTNLISCAAGAFCELRALGIRVAAGVLRVFEDLNEEVEHSSLAALAAGASVVGIADAAAAVAVA